MHTCSLIFLELNLEIGLKVKQKAALVINKYCSYSSSSATIIMQDCKPYLCMNRATSWLSKTKESHSLEKEKKR